ncbi:hypothetical protein [Kribbella sp. NPDC049584]|uniref:SCO4402 family protein n=1 Tax=Kribbella sp. NPDC049584 TaxID=3154833 RepID=UPI003435BB25
MDVVRYPRMRRDVLDSLAVLSDVEYQERAWIRGEGFQPGQYDDFGYHVHVLYDDAAVLPDPAESIGTVLVAGDEIERLRSLGQLLDALLAEHGDVSASVYMADPRWPEVGRIAALALAATIRTWAMPQP